MVVDDTKKQRSPGSGSPQPPFLPPLQHRHVAPTDDEIDLRELWSAVWQGRFLIIVVTAVFTAASVFLAISLPDIYRSEALLAPSEEAQGGGMSRMAGQLGGLASLAGLSVGSARGGDKVAMAMAVLKSRKFITGFIERHDVLPPLMAVDVWDKETNELIFDQDIYNVKELSWIMKSKAPEQAEPSLWDAYEVFTDSLTVKQDSESGFVTISIEHLSPFVARDWVMLLIKEINQEMREKDVGEAQKSIEFLQRQLAEVPLTDMRVVFYQLIEEQTKTIMLAEVREEYVFSVIDPPVVAEDSAKPRRLLIISFGMLLGCMLSILFVIVRHFLVAQRSQLVSGNDSDQE